MTLILCITIAICFAVIGWGLHILGQHPEYIEPVQEYPKEHDGWMIQHFLNERWRLQTEMAIAKDMATMSELWSEIDRLDWDFRNSVPDELLIVHIDELFAYHAYRANELRSLVMG